MKKIALIAFASVLFSSTAFSSSLDDQLAAVERAQNQAQAEKNAIAKKQAQRNLEIKRKQELAAKAKNDERLSDKYRDQAYQDELRQLEIEKMKLALQKDRTRVKREDDFIDQELKQKAAEADVTQSYADANRNISEGSRDLLKSTGKAKEKKAGSWFN